MSLQCIKMYPLWSGDARGKRSFWLPGVHDIGGWRKSAIAGIRSGRWSAEKQQLSYKLLGVHWRLVLLGPVTFPEMERWFWASCAGDWIAAEPRVKVCGIE